MEQIGRRILKSGLRGTTNLLVIGEVSPLLEASGLEPWFAVRKLQLFNSIGEHTTPLDKIAELSSKLFYILALSA